MNEKTLRFIDLFAGIGGFRLAIERVFNKFSYQSNCVFSNEWNKYATQIYNKNFRTNIIPTDIKTINERKLPDFDLLCGGFPCQTFSTAGKRAGFNDTRGTMFFEIARILKVKKPKFILLENVKGLLNHNKGKTFSRIIQVLEELGYNVQWMVLNSKFYGVPQNRERVFIICNFRRQSRPKILPFKNQFRESNDREFVKEKIYVNFLRRSQPLMGINGVSQTINAQGFGAFGNTGLYLINEFSDTNPIIRRLTPLECERLQGFPDGWTAEGTEGKISDTQRYKVLGNAVTVNVVETIIENWFFKEENKI